MKTSTRRPWVPTPTFLYRNYLYHKIAESLPKQSFFLDIGAGNGFFLKSLTKLGFYGESIDISKNAVYFAQQELKDNKNVIVKQADIFKYHPLKKYDVIFCLEMLEHVKNDSLAIKNMFRLLKPGGKLIISSPAHMSKWSEIDTIKGHYRRYERQEIISKMKDAGFKSFQIFTYGFPFLSLVRKFSSSGKMIKSTTKNKNKDIKGQESSIQQEYNPKLKVLVANPILLFPIFKIMDKFLQTDLGFGYLVIAKKPKPTNAS